MTKHFKCYRKRIAKDFEEIKSLFFPFLNLDWFYSLLPQEHKQEYAYFSMRKKESVL